MVKKKEDGEEVLTISAKSVVDILMFIQRVIDEAINMHPIMTRSLQFKQDCKKAIQKLLSVIPGMNVGFIQTKKKKI